MIDTFICPLKENIRLPLMKFELKEVKFKCGSFFSQGFYSQCYSHCLRWLQVPDSTEKEGLCQSCWISHQFNSRGLTPILLLSLFCSVNWEWLKHCIYTGVQFSEKKHPTTRELLFIFLPKKQQKPYSLSCLNFSLQKIIELHTHHVLNTGVSMTL